MLFYIKYFHICQHILLFFCYIFLRNIKLRYFSKILNWQVHFNLEAKPKWVENKIHNHWTFLVEPLDLGEAKSTVYVWIEKSLQNSIKRKKVMG